MLTPMGPHRYTFKRPNGVEIVYDLESLLRYFILTGNFCEPETRIFFEKDDLQKIDVYVQCNIHKLDKDLVDLLKIQEEDGSSHTSTTVSDNSNSNINSNSNSNSNGSSGTPTVTANVTTTTATSTTISQNQVQTKSEKDFNQSKENHKWKQEKEKQIDTCFWSTYKSMVNLRNNFKTNFAEQYFIRDALVGIERLIGDCVNEMLKIVEYTRPYGGWVISEFSTLSSTSTTATTAASAGDVFADVFPLPPSGTALGRSMSTSIRSAATTSTTRRTTNVNAAGNERNLDKNESDEEDEEDGEDIDNQHNHDCDDREEGRGNISSASGTSSNAEPVRFYDVEEAQMELITRIFPCCQDLLQQLYDKDEEYGKQVVRNATLFLKGPPNKPTKDTCSMLPIVLNFIQETEQIILTTLANSNSNSLTSF
jgi:hypothetical protein